MIGVGNEVRFDAQAAVLFSVHLYDLIFSGIDYHLLPNLSYFIVSHIPKGGIIAFLRRLLYHSRFLHAMLPLR